MNPRHGGVDYDCLIVYYDCLIVYNRYRNTYCNAYINNIVPVPSIKIKVFGEFGKTC